MSILQEEVSRLIEPMLQQRFYVVFSTMVQPLAALKSLLPDHLRYLIALEQRGVLFASGPHFDADGSLEGNSMTIVRAGSLEEADAIAAQDPLHAGGIRSYVVKGWQVNEGSYSVTVSYSSGTYKIS